MCKVIEYLKTIYVRSYYSLKIEYKRLNSMLNKMYSFIGEVR